MACTDIASGVNVSLGIMEEVTCGVTPPGATTPVPISLAAATPSSGKMQVSRAAGDFIVDGFLDGQYIEVVGAANAENNGFWRIATGGVAASILTLEDPDDETTTEIAGGGFEANIAFEGLRATERNVGLERDIIETSEVRKDRQFASVRHGFNRVTGSVGYELSLISYDTMIEMAMADRWQAVTVSATGALTLTPDAPGSKTAVLVRAAGDWVDDGIRIGDVLRGSGSATAANNTNYVVLEVTSVTDLKVGNPAETLVGGDPPTTVIFPGRRIDIGTVLNTLTVQRSYNDLPKYEVFRGVTVNNMSWTMAPGEVVGGTFDMLGMTAAGLSDTPLVNESLAPTTDFMSAFDGEMYEGGEHNAVVTSMEFTLENNRQLQAVVGSAFSPGMFEGRAGVSGTISAFFRGGPLFNKFINEEPTPITMKMNNPGAVDGAGLEFIAVTLPRAVFTGATISPPQEGPVSMDMPFRALALEVNDGAGETLITSITIQISNLVSDQRALLP